MHSVVRNLVEGIGIADSFPSDPKYFTQFSIQETLVIPSPKPDMEQLLAVTVEPVIESIKIITTPAALSNEGQNLTGYKLLIELRLKEKVRYVADEPTQTVHAAHYENSFKSLFIIVPGEINGVPIQKLLDKGRVIVTPYIEDIYAEMTNKRTIFKNVTIFLDVRFITCNL